jgi:hypothetical protein
MHSPEVVASHDQRYTRRRLGCREVKLPHASMCVRRAQHVRVCLAMQVVVALEATVAAQEALVLETPHWLADSELAHRSTRSPVAENSCSHQFLQLRVDGAGAILVLLSGAARHHLGTHSRNPRSSCGSRSQRWFQPAASGQQTAEAIMTGAPAPPTCTR